MDLLSLALGASVGAAGAAAWAMKKTAPPEPLPPPEPPQEQAGDLLHRTAIITSETRSPKDAFRVCVDAATRFTGWEGGCVYVHREGPYRVTESSILFELDPDDPLDPLRRLIRAAKPTPGRSLMGRAIASGKTEYEPELAPSVTWASVAIQEGFTAGIALPVMTDGKVRAIMLFFMRNNTPPDPAKVEIVEGVAAQLGRVLERDEAYRANADLAAIVETTSDSVIGFSPDGVITSWNSGAEALYGFTAAEVLGGPIFCTIPQSREREMLDLLDLLGRGERVEALETERVTKDGEHIDVSLAAAPIQTHEGQVIGASSIERDITESKRAERRLARYRTIVQSSDDAIIGVTSVGKVISCNPGAERLVGREAATLMGKTLAPLLPADRSDEITQLLKSTRQGRHLQGHETIWMRKDGMPVEVALTVSPIFDANDRVQGAVFVGRDITQQKRTERSLKRTAGGLTRSNAELEKFAYVVSHDLKAPMRAIRGLSEWIEDDLDDLMEDQTREHMSLLRGRVVRMEGLLDGLLAYSRAGRMRAAPEDVDCVDLLADIQALLDVPDGFGVHCSPDLPTVRAPRAPLRQVFHNLIDNAIKHHNGPPGRVDVSWSTDAPHGMIKFSVADDGPGIDPQFHERIFEIFQTLKRRDEVEGTGMGLAIVTKVVNTFGGDITIDSVQGEGTTFHFTWPLEFREEGN